MRYSHLSVKSIFCEDTGMAGSGVRLGWVLVPALVFALFGGGGAVSGAVPRQFPSQRIRHRMLLDSSFEKVQKDTARLVELVALLQEELCKDENTSLPAGIPERVERLAGKSRELQKAVKEANKNQLSFQVYSLAKKIEEEGRGLREIFKVLTPRHRSNRFRRMANDIRKKAGSVKNKMRLP